MSKKIKVKVNALLLDKSTVRDTVSNIVFNHNDWVEVDMDIWERLKDATYKQGKTKVSVLIADDEKPIMKKSRFETFKRKYDDYKEIYNKNKSHLRFANWFFERKYLGYSHSTQIKDVFENCADMYNSLDLKSIPDIFSITNNI